MRTLFVVSACVIVISAPALACRGTVEYPQAFEQLNEAEVSPESKAELTEQLSQGQALHEEGHRLGDTDKMSESLHILDAIMEELGQ